MNAHHLLDGPVHGRCHVQRLAVIGVPCAIIIIIIVVVNDVGLALDGLLGNNVDSSGVLESFHDGCFACRVAGLVFKALADMSKSGPPSELADGYRVVLAFADTDVFVAQPETFVRVQVAHREPEVDLCDVSVSKSVNMTAAWGHLPGGK